MNFSATQSGCLTRSYGAYEPIIGRVFERTYLGPPLFDPKFRADRLDKKNISVTWLWTREIYENVKRDTVFTVFQI